MLADEWVVWGKMLDGGLRLGLFEGWLCHLEA